MKQSENLFIFVEVIPSARYRVSGHSESSARLYTYAQNPACRYLSSIRFKFTPL